MLQPWLNVINSAKAGTFYKIDFGATETYRMESPDGGLVLQLNIAGAAFWVSGQSFDPEGDTPAVPTGEYIKLLLITEDPDALFERAIQAGANEVFSVGEDYGWRLGRLTDPFGFDWEIGKKVS